MVKKNSCFHVQLTKLMMKAKSTSQNPEFCITLAIFITIVLFVFVAIAKRNHKFHFHYLS